MIDDETMNSSAAISDLVAVIAFTVRLTGGNDQDIAEVLKQFSDDYQSKHDGTGQ